MLFEHYEDFEVTAVWTLGVVFSVWESRRPAHAISRKADWRRDALALLVLIVGVNASRLGIQQAVRASGLDVRLASGSWNRWPVALQLVVAALLVDLSIYWVHRFMHTRLMWNAHKWHHSIEQLYWFAGNRTSLVHAFLFAVPQIVFGLFVFKFSAVQIGLISCFGIFMQYFIHSNLHVPLGPIEWILVTPQNHRRHHAYVAGAPHGNYASTFAFWDRLFGTYVDWRDLPHDYPLGLGERDKTARMAIGI